MTLATKNLRIETGTLLGIPLWNKRYALAKVLYVSKWPGKLSQFGIYRHYLDQYNSLQSLPTGRQAYWEPFLFTYATALKGEPWQCLGRVELDEADRNLSFFWSDSNYLQHGDDIVRRLNGIEFMSYICCSSLEFPDGIRCHGERMVAYLDGCSPEESGFIAQRFNPQPGDILAIPLRNGRYVPAQLLYLSRFPFEYQKALLRIHKQALDKLEMPAGQLDKSSSSLRYVLASHLEDGRWPRIGHQPLAKDEAVPPLSVDRGRLFQGDQYLREATDAECSKMISDSIVWEIGRAEQQVHEWFGCPPRVPAKPAPPPQEETDELWIKAAEWVAQLSRARTWRPAEKAFAFAIEVKYLELDECYEAIAAAEVVAAALGKPEKTLPPEAKAWAGKHRAGITPELVQLAAAALDRIRKDSELSEEIATASEELKPWSNRLASLAKRLKR